KLLRLVEQDLHSLQGLDALRNDLIIHGSSFWILRSWRAAIVIGRCSLIELIFPIRWDAPVWSGRRLVKGPRSRRRQRGAVERPSGSIVPEPVLTRLEACYDEVAGLAKMRSGVLVWRRIATADVAAFGAAP